MAVELSKNKNKAIKRIIRMLHTEPLMCQYCPVGCEFSKLSSKARKEIHKENLSKSNSEDSCFSICGKKRLQYIIENFNIKDFTIRQYIYRNYLNKIYCVYCLASRRKITEKIDFISCNNTQCKIRDEITGKMGPNPISCVICSTYILGQYLQKNSSILQLKEKR